MATHFNCYWKLHIKYCGIYCSLSPSLFLSSSHSCSLSLIHTFFKSSFHSLQCSHSLFAPLFGNCVKYQSRFASHVKLMKLQRDLRHGTIVNQGGRQGGAEVVWRRGGKGNGDDTSLTQWMKVPQGNANSASYP